MASTLVLLLQLLLVSLSSASSFFGGTVTYTYKGRNPDGTFRVDLRNRATFDDCQNFLDWFCYAGNCGYNTSSERGVVDRSNNAPQYDNQWCETETVSTRSIPSDNPFQMNSASCCWIPTRNWVHSLTLMTYVDLGTRSDTGKPNQSPEVAILPLLRVPQNCPRTYKLMSFDPDGDRVRCRYGNIIGTECSSCSQPSGFDLDQGSCTLRYRDSYADARVYGFELVVEDFPQGHISLTYTDGSRSSRDPLIVRKKRQITVGTKVQTTTTKKQPTTTKTQPTTTKTQPTTTKTQPTTTKTQPTTTKKQPTTTKTQPTTTKTTVGTTTSTTTTTEPPTTPAPTTTELPTTTAPTTTEPITTTPWWWFYGTTTTEPPTTPAPTTTEPITTTPWWWWYSTTTTEPPTTSTPTTTEPPTTTAPTTTVPITTIPWWWWWHSTTTTEPPTTSTPTTVEPPTTTAPTTTEPPTTTTPTTTVPITTIPWWWWWHSTTTTEPPTTTTPTTTDPPTTTAAPTTFIPWDTTTTETTTTTTPEYTSSRTHLHTNTPPLSKLPLQFSVLVDPPAPSCQEGLYLPKFVNPTPEDGAHIQAQVNKEVEIRVKAQATYAEIHDIIISGPLNIRKLRTTHDEFVIRWTPTPDDLGGHYPICFAVESLTWSTETTAQTTQNYNYLTTPPSRAAIYQSEMRCVLVNIGTTQVAANVICSQSTMTVEVEKSSFSGLNEDDLQLKDPSNIACSFRTHSNSTHFIAVIPLSACGTEIEEDGDNLIFKNEITTVDNTEDLITRKDLLEVHFFCQYPKRGNLTLGYTKHRKSVTVWEKGSGAFTYRFEFFSDNQFQTMFDPSSYPVEFEVGSRIYMQIDATSSANNTVLFVESCSATPSDDPNYRPAHAIIENGCKVDSTVEIYSSTDNRKFRISIEAFKFKGLHDQMYITCSVLVCEAGDPNSRCSQGCINSTSPGGQHHNQRKREAATQTSRHLVSQGPLRVRRSAENTGSRVISLDLNLVFIAGCLLAAVAMICAFVVYKAKMSAVTNQPLPTFIN